MEHTRTRERLLLAAERLFGQKGIDAVSLREINVAAGQRNTSATHYHFGSKEALVAAVFDARQEVLGRRRDEMLDALAEGGGPKSVRSLARVLIDPLADLAADEQGACHYVSFLAQLFLQPPAGFERLIGRPDGALPRLARDLTKVAAVPESLSSQRIMIMSQHVATSLAIHRHLRHHATASGRPLLPLPVFALALLDGVTAYLAAPVSAELRSALDQARL